MIDLNEQTNGLSRFLSEEIYDRDVLLSTATIVLVAAWFTREIFGGPAFESETLDLLFNLVVLFFVTAAIRTNYDVNDPRVHLRERLAGGLSLPENVLVVVVIAIFLAQMGAIVHWDLPYDYHPGDDEFIVPSMFFSQFDVASAISNPNLSQNPLYDNQHLMYYVLTPYYLLLNVLGLLDSVTDYFLAARVLNYLVAMLVMLTTYVVANELYGRTAAVAAIVLFPVTRQFAHYALFMRPDVLLTFLVTVLFLVHVGTYEDDRRNYIAAGLLIGLGTSLKPYALVFAMPFLFLIAADVFVDAEYDRAVVQLSQLLAPVILFFHVGRFYHTYMRRRLGAGFRTSIDTANAGNGIFPEPGGVIDRLEFAFTLHTWWNGVVHTVMLVLAILAICLLLTRNGDERAKSLPVLLFVVPFALFMGSQILQSGRYFLPVLPVAFIAVGRSFDFLYRNKRTAIRVSVILLFLGVLVQPAMITGVWTYSLTQPDPRTEAGDWVADNVDNGSHVSYLGGPNWQKPPLPDHRYHVHALNDETDYVIVTLSSYHRVKYYLDEGYSIERIGEYEENPRRAVNITRQVFDEESTLTVEGKEFVLVSRFQRRQEVGGYALNDYRQHPASWDVWAVTNPMEIRIYERADT